MVQVVDWGEREYRASLDAMRALVRASRAGEIPDTLILVEHPAVVTVGVEGDDGAAAASGLPVVTVERGGRATYHAPGQLVGTRSSTSPRAGATSVGSSTRSRRRSCARSRSSG